MAVGLDHEQQLLPSGVTSPRPDAYLERQRERIRQMHRSQVLVGFLVMSAALITNGTYYVITRDQPHRPLMWLLQAVALLPGILALRPPRWIATHRIRRSILQHAWVSTQLVLIGLTSALDGGLGSPLLLMLFFTVAVAAMGFTPASVGLHIATAIGTALTVGALTGTLDLGRGLLWSSALLTTALSAAAIARRHRNLATELQRTNAELHRLARTDPLTGCLNRRAYHESLEAELRRYEEDGTPFVVVMLDLDEFKRVNDDHGHPVGDAVLIAVAAALRSSIRGDDLVARSGGEEFSVLLPDTPADQAPLVAERLRAAVASARGPVEVTASAGLAAVPDHATTYVEVVRVADRAMYAAKRAGRDRLVVAIA